MKIKRVFYSVLAAVFVMTGCAFAGAPPIAPADSRAELSATSGLASEIQLSPAPAASQPAPAPINADAEAPRPGYKGNGTVTYAKNDRLLTDAQEKLLGDYMNTYYTSLALLDTQSFSGLFADKADKRAASDLALLKAVVGVRKMQRTNLSLSKYSFELVVQSAEKREDGDLRVRVLENSTQNFRVSPGVNSKSYNISHSFVLTKTGTSWRISEHNLAGSLNRLVMGLGKWQPGSSAPASAIPSDINARLKTFLADSRANVAARGTRGRAAKEVAVDHGYDRSAAVDYAEEWVNTRNPEWPVYDRLGGNCQNYASQAILAGGIPMDYTSPGQWKWYGGTPNASFAAAGRSPAWSGVSEFLSYVQNNKGRGMVAAADAPYYSGEPGDIIIMGVKGDWRHTVVITKALKDSAGKTVDYLIDSNTSNLRDFPASAYYYTEQMLIKIYGWND
ncbi:hypothetical protein FACS1894191_8310 [Clostridia bacterium]|nr:hypothetical protein FACS1894191_8310 [Clostridia bacterium]